MTPNMERSGAGDGLNPLEVFSIRSMFLGDVPRFEPPSTLFCQERLDDEEAEESERGPQFLGYDVDSEDSYSGSEMDSYRPPLQAIAPCRWESEQPPPREAAAHGQTWQFTLRLPVNVTCESMSLNLVFNENASPGIGLGY